MKKQNIALVIIVAAIAAIAVLSSYSSTVSACWTKTPPPPTVTTVAPTDQPTVEPTDQPTVEPTDQPTVEPTDQPTVEPTDQPHHVVEEVSQTCPECGPEREEEDAPVGTLVQIQYSVGECVMVDGAPTCPENLVYFRLNVGTSTEDLGFYIETARGDVYPVSKVGFDGNTYFQMNLLVRQTDTTSTSFLAEQIGTGDINALTGIGSYWRLMDAETHKPWREVHGQRSVKKFVSCSVSAGPWFVSVDGVASAFAPTTGTDWWYYLSSIGKTTSNFSGMEATNLWAANLRELGTLELPTD